MVDRITILFQAFGPNGYTKVEADFLSSKKLETGETGYCYVNAQRTFQAPAICSGDVQTARVRGNTPSLWEQSKNS